MRRLLSLLLTLSILLPSSSFFLNISAKESSNDNSSFVDGEVIVEFKSSVSGLSGEQATDSFDLPDLTVENAWDFDSNELALSGSVDVQTEEDYSTPDSASIVHFKSDSLSTNQLVSHFESCDDVVSVQPNYKYSLPAEITDKNQSLDLEQYNYDSSYALSDDSDSFSTEQANLENKNFSLSGLSNNFLSTNLNLSNQFENQWGLYNTGSLKNSIKGIDINVKSIWDAGVVGSDDVVIAVIDTGLDTSNENFNSTSNNKYSCNLWNNGKTGCGYNAINKTSEPRYIEDYDKQGHGTHVAGIIGGNGYYISGVMKNVKIMPIKAIDKDGITTTSLLIESYKFIENQITRKGARVAAINMSLGGLSPSPKPLDKLLLKKINHLGKNHGVITVCASGNENVDLDKDKLQHFPSSLKSPYIFSVGSISSNGQKANSSNYGISGVDVMAPGNDIMSVYSRNSEYYRQSNKPYGYLCGTSMATPFVTGSVGLLKAYSNKNHKGWSAEEIKDRIMGSTTSKSNLSQFCLAGGYINLNNAINNPAPVITDLEVNENIITIKGRFFGKNANSLEIRNFPSKQNSKTIDYLINSWSDNEIVATLWRLPENKALIKVNSISSASNKTKHLSGRIIFDFTGISYTLE